MRSEARSQKPEVRSRGSGLGTRDPGVDTRRPVSSFRFLSLLATRHSSLVTAWLLVTCHLSLATAFGATHVTGTYSLGENPTVMATVNGTPEYGLVFVQRSKLVTYNNVQYGTQVTEGYLEVNGQLNDGAGNLWLDLIPSTTASPGDSYYVVTINIQGHVHSEIWVVPEVAAIDAAAVRQAQPPSASVSTPFYQFIQQSGADLPQRLKLNLSGSGVSCADNAAQLSTDCSITGGTGGGSAPIASATTSGTVKTDSTVADPVVYLKSSSDSLLAGKANLSHTHVESDVTNLVTDLAGKVPSSRTITTTAPLAGGGSLASNLTLSIPAASGSENGYLSSGDWTTFNGKENPLSFSAPLSRSVNTISCPTCEITGNKNAAGGYAGLTASSKLNASQGQEVWSVTDLTDYSATSGSGATALKTTVSAPSSGQCLTWSGSNWVNGSCSGGSSNHNLLSATHPDTVPASPVLGDLLYANSTPAWTKLAGNTTATKKYLSQTGNGSLSAAPVWSQMAAADVSGLATVATSGAYGDLSATPQLANSISQVSHKWLDSFNASTGNFTQSQPACGDLSDGSGGCSMSTTAAGDLSGTLPSVSVVALHFGATQQTLSSTAPTSGQCLYYNGTNIAGTSCGSGGGAATDLSNLANPTAINLTTLTFAGAGGLTATGSTSNITLTPGSSGAVAFGGSGDLTLTATATNGNIVLAPDGTGAVLFGTDNTFDLGASAASRPKNGYFGTSVVAPTVNATTALQINGTGIASATQTLTNKTVDAEGTGNTVTIPAKSYVAFASCSDGSTSSLAVDAASAQTTACYGTNTKTGVWQAADADAVMFGLHLPSDWTGAIDATLSLNTPDTSGTVIFNIATACVVTDGSTADDPSYNSSSAFTTITLGTPASAARKTSVTGITATGCVAGGWANFKVARATDTATSRVNVKGVTLTVRRAM